MSDYKDEAWERSEDIGNGVRIRYLGWHPDRELNPQYVGVPDIDKYGIIVSHLHQDGSVCEGFVTFNTQQSRTLNNISAKAGHARRPLWEVHSWDPLHIEPSVSVKGGPDGAECLHGFIREGRWVPC